MRQDGYITAAGASRFIEWQVNDTTDNFELTRENTDILGFDIQLPLITDDITASSTVTSTGFITTAGGIYDTTGAVALTIGSGDVTAILLVTDGGGVGIGTTAPTTLLEISDGSNGFLTIDPTVAFGVDINSHGANSGSAESNTQLQLGGSLKTRDLFGIVFGSGNDFGLRMNSGNSNTLELKNNSGTVLVSYQNTGNVGIGTNSPDNLLHIKSIGDAAFKVEADSDNSGENDNPTIILSQDGGAIHGRIGIAGDAGVLYVGAIANATFLEAIGVSSAVDLQFVTGGDLDAPSIGTARMTIDQSGNIGIGTAGPAAKLEVTGNLLFTEGAARTITVEDEVTGVGQNLSIIAGRAEEGGGGDLNLTGGFGSDGDGGDVNIDGGDGDNEGNVILANIRGNVGIGTSTPLQKLDVAGNLKVTGTTTLVGSTNTCILTVDADGTCDAGTAIVVDNSIAICAVCAAN